MLPRTGNSPNWWNRVIATGRPSFVTGRLKQPQALRTPSTRGRQILEVHQESGLKMPVNLFQAVKAHSLDLESSRGITPGADLEVLDRRIEAARQLSEWIARALELDPLASPATQTPPSSTSPADRS
jgi:hypothetical protein